MKVSSKYVSWGIRPQSFPRRHRDRIKNGKEGEKKFGESDKCQSPFVRDTRGTKGNGRRPIVQAIMTKNFLMSHG